MDRNYKIGTRTSPLALRQVEEVLNALKKFYPAINTEIVTIETYGDRDKAVPISEVEGSDFFTREIDEALINGEIDFAVHSAKDLADNLRQGLVIAALTKSIDPYDILVSKGELGLEKLPYGAIIGTSSMRRKQGLKKFRPDFQIVDIRGNIEERLQLLDTSPEKIGDFPGLSPRNFFEIPEGNQQSLDAIVIAAAGLLRLGLAHRITERIPFEIIKPHPLQGALAIVARSKDLQLLDFLSVIDSGEAIAL